MGPVGHSGTAFTVQQRLGCCSRRGRPGSINPGTCGRPLCAGVKGRTLALLEPARQGRDQGVGVGRARAADPSRGTGRSRDGSSSPSPCSSPTGAPDTVPPGGSGHPPHRIFRHPPPVRPHPHQGLGGKLRSGAVKSSGEKVRKNCGPVTKPPAASTSNTSAQGTRRAPTVREGGRQNAMAKKLQESAEHCEALRKLRESAEHCEALRKLRESAEHCEALRKLRESAEHCEALRKLRESAEHCEALRKLRESAEHCEALRKLRESAEHCEALRKLLESAEHCKTLQNCDKLQNGAEIAKLRKWATK